MTYIKRYKTNDDFSDILLSSDGTYLTGLWFEGSYDDEKLNHNYEEKDLKIFDETKKWLDIYFSGKEPCFTPKYKIENLSCFRKIIMDILIKIPYGKTVTYNDIAKEVAKIKGIKKMSAQAVGTAVGKNPICIIIPCHRVVGKNGNLTGFGGGLKNKIGLLKIENNDMENFFIPKKGNKL